MRKKNLKKFNKDYNLVREEDQRVINHREKITVQARKMIDKFLGIRKATENLSKLIRLQKKGRQWLDC